MVRSTADEDERKQFILFLKARKSAGRTYEDQKDLFKEYREGSGSKKCDSTLKRWQYEVRDCDEYVPLIQAKERACPVPPYKEHVAILKAVCLRMDEIEAWRKQLES